MRPNVSFSNGRTRLPPNLSNLHMAIITMLQHRIVTTGTLAVIIITEIVTVMTAMETRSRKQIIWEEEESKDLVLNAVKRVTGVLTVLKLKVEVEATTKAGVVSLDMGTTATTAIIIVTVMVIEILNPLVMAGNNLILVEGKMVKKQDPVINVGNQDIGVRAAQRWEVVINAKYSLDSKLSL